MSEPREFCERCSALLTGRELGDGEPSPPPDADDAWWKRLRLTHWENRALNAEDEILRLKLQFAVAECYFAEDVMHDSPEEFASEYDLELGAEFELQSATYWEEKFRVTKKPDDVNDDYECEQIGKKRAEFPTYFDQKARADKAEAELAKLRSGAAQEVSPPSPESATELGNEVNDLGNFKLNVSAAEFAEKLLEEEEAACGREMVKRDMWKAKAEKAEGDTRELKAALRRAKELVEPLIETEGDMAPEWDTGAKEFLAEAERLLG